MTTVRPLTIAAVSAGASYIMERVIAIIHPVGDKHGEFFADALNSAFWSRCLPRPSRCPTSADGWE